MKLPVLWSPPPTVALDVGVLLPAMIVLYCGTETESYGQRADRAGAGGRGRIRVPTYLVNAGLLAGQSYYQMIVG